MRHLPIAFLVATITFSIWELLAGIFGGVEKHGSSGGRGPRVKWERSVFDEQRGP